MDKKEFADEFKDKVDEDNLVDKLYDEMAGVCREHNISEEEISNDELLELCETFVENGLDSI